MKKTLRLAGILCLIASLFDVASLMLDIFYYTFSVFYVVFDSLCVGLSVATGIIFLSLMDKSEDYLIKRKSLFLTLMILNIFNGLVVWVISFWVQITITKKLQNSTFPNFSENKSENKDGSNTINLDEEGYKERKIAKDLTEKLEELLRLKEKNLITEEEYKAMREEAIKKYIS